MYSKNLNSLKNSEQLNLGISNNNKNIFFNFYSSFRKYVQKRKIEIEASNLWKNFAFIFSTTFFICIFLYFTYLYIFNFNNIPTKIPFLYNHQKQFWELVDKTFLSIYLGVIFVLEVLIINFSLRIFPSDKKYATFIWCLNIGVMLLFAIGINQIFRLII